MLLTLSSMPLALPVVRINVPKFRGVTYPLTVVPPSWGYSLWVGRMIAAAENAMRYAMCASMLDLYTSRSMDLVLLEVILTAGHSCRCLHPAGVI